MREWKGTRQATTRGAVGKRNEAKAKEERKVGRGREGGSQAARERGREGGREGEREREREST